MSISRSFLRFERLTVTIRAVRTMSMDDHEWEKIKIPKVNVAKEKFDSGLTKPWEWREKQLIGLRNFLDQEKDAIFKALDADLGRVPLEATVEWVNCRNQIQCMLKNGKKMMKKQKVSSPMMHLANTCYRQPEPLGTALIMGAWNYPFDLTLGPLSGAIAAGNTAIVKPSEVSAASGALMAEKLGNYIDTDAFPVFVEGPEGSSRLLKERYDIIFFTGGTHIGKIVMRAAAEHLTPVVLELGGKNPVWIDQTANFNVTASRLMFGKCINSGQICIAPNYVMCTKEVEVKLVETIKKLMEDWYKNDPQASDSYSGKMVSQRHYDRLAGMLKETKGTVAIGGKTIDEGRYIEPTVLTNVKLDDPVMKDEIFGPIMPIINVDNLDEALKIIKKEEKPLASYCFADDKKVCEKWIQNVSSGGMCINDTIMHISNENLPFGGVGHSGMGAYHGVESFKVFSHYKSVLEQNTPQFLMKTRSAPFGADAKTIKAFEKIAMD